MKPEKYPRDFAIPPNVWHLTFPTKGVRTIAREVESALGRGSPTTILRYLHQMKKKGLVVRTKKKWTARIPYAIIDVDYPVPIHAIREPPEKWDKAYRRMMKALSA